MAPGGLQLACEPLRARTVWSAYGPTTLAEHENVSKVHPSSLPGTERTGGVPLPITPETQGAAAVTDNPSWVSVTWREFSHANRAARLESDGLHR
ncbi:hypothetical protein SKAU_G00073920 [Synaphobranchus kaupii]|uniref:Uncharacterized protein n=1 Tax=Synaphobranchus kaupii TaxID=118154 RepID=A0A9Q1G8D6_SYNKA|nr:hypothetical protein SKAU_G00073920 [Synaphobranchus kaupii]